MVIVINGPLGVGKSSLGEALSENIHESMYLDGDHIVAANPQPANPLELLHSAIRMLVSHFGQHGYRHFVISHYWESPEALDDLRRHLRQIDPRINIRCFLTLLPLEENIARIHGRQAARAIDELDFELRTVREERRALSQWRDGEVGELFDVSAPLDELVRKLLALLQQDLNDEI